MRPRKRYLSGNHGTEAPTSLLFFDTESFTRPNPHIPMKRDFSLRLWVAAHVIREGAGFRPAVYHHGHTAQQFWDLVERLQTWKKPLWCFAHNLGHDLTQLDFWTQLERLRWTAGPVPREPSPKTGKARPPWRGCMCLEGRPTFLILRGKNGTLRLVDTCNYWPTKLADIGARLGIPKLPMPAFTAPDSAWHTYCTRDVDVTRAAVCDLIDRWTQEDCGIFRMTAGALAMTNFQHQAECKVDGRDEVNIVLEDDSPSRALERAAYLGGRIEPFFIGHHAGPIYYLDCNALYGHVMADNYFPRCRGRCVSNSKSSELERYMLCHGAAADVLINTGTTDTTYPQKRERNQVHPCGRFWTTLCGPELLRALRAGHVEKVGEAWLYSLQKLFKGWVERWMQQTRDARASGDTGTAEFSKLMYTSLPGKFGQKGDWWVDDPKLGRRKGWCRGADWWEETGEWSELRWIAGHGQRRVRGKEGRNSFPIISAYVCAYGREHMRTAFTALPERSLLYSATDSIVTTRAGYNALVKRGLVDDDAPGKFRLVDTYQDCTIHGPNWYTIGDRVVCSGLHGRAYSTPDGEQFVEVWDHLPALLSGNPNGKSGVELIPLAALQPTMKNDAAGDGWRRPYRLSLDPEFTDRPPRLLDRRLRPEPV